MPKFALEVVVEQPICTKTESNASKDVEWQQNMMGRETTLIPQNDDGSRDLGDLGSCQVTLHGQFRVTWFKSDAIRSLT